MFIQSEITEKDCVCVCVCVPTGQPYILWPDVHVIMNSSIHEEELLYIKLFRKEHRGEKPLCGPWLRAQRCVCVCEINVVPICEAVFLERRPVRSGNTPQISITL